MTALAALVLAAVLSVGAVAKLADRERSAEAIAAFGVPHRIAGWLGWVLTGGELAIAAALLPERSRLVGAAGALALLAILTTAVATNLLRGRTPECHCFGRLSRGPLGWAAVARNGMLACLAGFVVAGGHEPGLFAGLLLACTAAWLALGPLAAAAGRRSAPSFTLADEWGERWTLAQLLSGGRPVLLVFSQPGCGACHALLPALEEWQARLGDRLRIAVIGAGGEGGGGPRGQASYTTLVDPAGSVAPAYGVTATPSAVLIEPGGRTRSALAIGATAVGELVGTRFAAEEAPRFPRRAVIARAAQGAAALGAFPLAAAACGSGKPSSRATAPSTASTGTTSGRPNALRVGSTYICQQEYALCTNAPCVPSPHNPDVVICDCVVKSGYSVGLTACPKRAPHGTTLYSTFSTALVTSSTRAMTCPANVPWANCVDAICELDPKDPTKARCQCPLVKTGPSFTLGGGCDTRTCGKTIWSAAHTNLGGGQVAAAMKRLGQPLANPAPCPKS